MTVETDTGLVGLGEGGSKDTIVQCAGLLIGESPNRIEHLQVPNGIRYFDRVLKCVV